MRASFTGFPAGGVDFFHALSINMNREWFKAHQADYQQLWHAPMEAFLEAVRVGLAAAYPKTKQSRVKLLRIYRDVRFARDKSPYKTSIAGLVPLFGEETALMGGTSLYCDFGARPFVAMGRWMLESDQLKRFRAAVAADKTGAPFAEEVAKATKAGFELTSVEQLKKVPKGFDPEHPRGALLRHKGCAVSFPTLEPEQLQSKKLVDWVVKRASERAYLMRWLEAAVGVAPWPKR